MKQFKTLIAAGLAGAVILASAGCANGKPGSQPSDTAASGTETKASETATESTGSETEESTEAVISTHKVEVTPQTVEIMQDGNYEFKTVIPYIVVDGEEAVSINAEISKHVNENHPLQVAVDVEGETLYRDGEATRYAWGARGNILSVVVIASETFTDAVAYDVFNYNLDTLQAASDDEVIGSFGMTGEEFRNKVADAYRAYWNSETYLQNATDDLEKSIGAISSENVRPFVMPNGDPGAAGLIYITESQFYDMVNCFDLDTLTREYFPAE